MDKERCKTCDQYMCFIESEGDEEFCEYPWIGCGEFCKKYHTAECCYYYDRENDSCTL